MLCPKKNNRQPNLVTVHSNTGSEPTLYISFYFSQPFNFKERTFMKVQFSFLSTATYTPWSHETTLGLILKIPKNIPKIYFLNTTKTGTQKQVRSLSTFLDGTRRLIYIALSYLEKPIFKLEKNLSCAGWAKFSKTKVRLKTDYETKLMVII